MIDGCLEWRKNGLGIPEIVEQASDAYFDGQDDIGQWLEECTELRERAFSSSAALFDSWQNWCGKRGFAAGTQRNLTDTLIDRGLNYDPTKRARGFKDIALKE